MLTNKQISDYWENGYSFPYTAFSEEQAQKYFNKFLELEEEFGAYHVRNEINFKTHTILEWCQEIVQTPKVLDYVESLIGPNIICWSSTFFIKSPNRQEFISFHQDDRYFRPSESDKTVSIWLGLNNSNIDTGCMQYVPGVQEELPHAHTKHKNNLLPRVLKSCITSATFFSPTGSYGTCGSGSLSQYSGQVISPLHNKALGFPNIPIFKSGVP